jgi:hypothetical protein
MSTYPRFKFIDKEYTLVYPSENTLKFNSSFESGNLSKAVKVNENEYDLYLEYDTETQGYTQWFYFSVKSYKAKHTVKFNILNMSKPNSLFTKGLQPLYFSSKTSKNWQRGGSEISYLSNSIPRKTITPGQPTTYFTLSFTFTFTHSDERVFFAQSYPYTYNQLTNYLQEIRITSKLILKVSNLCKTLAGNDCPLVTITENIDQYEETKKNDRKVVFITSRVHPGETNSSYVVKGIIDYLLTNTKEAKSLRKKFVFKIVPMLNPDGVIYGNYRCSLLGVDLNRRWKNPNLILHPTIYHTKQLITSLHKTNGIFFYCDIHGHSRKQGSFIYGCRKKPASFIENKENILVKLFPLIMASRYNNFDYSSCRFAIEKCKESTARVVLFKELGIIWSFTLENSFLGLNCEYDQPSLQEIGYSVCNVLWFCRSWKKIKKGTEQIFRNLCSSDKASVNLNEAIESISPGIIDQIYSEKDFDGSDPESDCERKSLWAKGQDLKVIIRKRPQKSSQNIIRLPSKSPASQIVSVIRSISVSKAARQPALTLKDKNGSFKRIKIFHKTISNK